MNKIATRIMRRKTGFVLWLVLSLMLSLGTASAQDDLASSGNGGTVMPSANGGAAALGDVMSGANSGNAVLAGDTGGADISGGATANSTDGAVDVNAGTAIGDGSGGEYNIGYTYEPAPKPDVEEVAFEVCYEEFDGPTTCTTGSCERGDAGQICYPDDCGKLGLDKGCFLALSSDCNVERCTFAECTVKQNSATCVEEPR